MEAANTTISDAEAHTGPQDVESPLFSFFAELFLSFLLKGV